MDRLEILKKILAHEEEKEARWRAENFDGPVWWSRSEVGVSWHDMDKLVFEGLVEADGTRHPNYHIVDREKLRQIIAEEEKKKASGVDVEAEVSEADLDHLFDNIIGYDNIKTIILTAIKSGEPTHFLFLGTPGTAKTVFLLDLSRLPRASYVLGSSSTKAGIAEFLLEQRPRFLLIDEIDKMRGDDLGVLLSLMETGRLVLTKYRQRTDVELKCWVFASGNKENMPPELLSRFGAFVFHFPPYSREEYIRITTTFLSKTGLATPDIASYIAEVTADKTRDVRYARSIARIAKTKEQVDTVMGMLSGSAPIPIKSRKAKMEKNRKLFLLTCLFYYELLDGGADG